MFSGRFQKKRLISMKDIDMALYNNRFEIIFENITDIIEDHYLIKLKDVWAQFDGVLCGSIFTEKAQQHILKVLNVETKNVYFHQFDEENSEFVNNNIDVVEHYDKNNALLYATLGIKTFTGKAIFGEYNRFVGKQKTVIIKFIPEEFGLVKVLPDFLAKGFRSNGGKILVKYGLSKEKEELKQELLKELTA